MNRYPRRRTTRIISDDGLTVRLLVLLAVYYFWTTTTAVTAWTSRTLSTGRATTTTQLHQHQHQQHQQLSSITEQHSSVTDDKSYYITDGSDYFQDPYNVLLNPQAAAAAGSSGSPSSSNRAAASAATRITLTRYLDNLVKQDPSLRDLESLLLGLQMACKTISNLVNRAGLVYSGYIGSNQADAADDDNDHFDTSTADHNNGAYSDGRFYSMKRLDQLSTLVLKNALKYTGKCEVVVPAVTQTHECPAQHQPGVLIAKSLDSSYVAVLDPLDGSGK